MTEHTFAPGDRAYHVVRREIVVLGTYPVANVTLSLAIQTGSESFEYFTSTGKSSPNSTHPLLLPLYHPDVPERCREKKPKRKVKVVRWTWIHRNGGTSRIWHTAQEALLDAHELLGQPATTVELRGSYEVDDE